MAKVRIDWRDEAWKTAYGRVKAVGTARWLWERVFTVTEKYQLGDDFDHAYTHYRGAVGMWMQLHGVSARQAVVAVATRCDLLDKDTGQALLRACGEAPDDPLEAVNWAVATGGLVLVGTPRTLYWEGAEIPLCWSTSCWGFVWSLARQSKCNGVVDAETCDTGCAGSAVKSMKWRTVHMDGFPPSLAAKIMSSGMGSYRLDLLPSQIYVFEIGAAESLREWRP